MAENKTKPTAASVEDYIALKSQRATHRLPELMVLFKKSHPALTKNVGTQHRRVSPGRTPNHLRGIATLPVPAPVALWISASSRRSPR